MKILITFLLAFCGYSANIYAASDWKNTAIPVQTSSKFQKQIDKALSQVFMGKLHGTFCLVFQNQESLSHSLGASTPTAAALRQTCPRNTESNALSTKLDPKVYLISFDGPRDLDSWTDAKNRTFIFVNENLSQQRLKSILLHEISIALDAKYNFTIRDYLRELERREYSPVGNLNNLESAFISSMWRPIAQTFSALRAFNVEAANNGLNSITLTANSCASRFHQIFKIVRGISYTAPAMTVETMLNNPQELLIARQSEAVAPQNASDEQQLLRELTSPAFQIRDFTGRQVSFCEFMAAPALTSNALGSFTSNGPRPRLTGGSGGSSSLISEDKAVHEALNEVRRAERQN
ncbi:hypothetical protein [Bdellovibrio sp. HCB274]|uniref:hypothetical protein n=1 Tax=Bdellovibrio sp. HCB274 TaxID=3394361 RepID=UPI0039B58AF5